MAILTTLRPDEIEQLMRAFGVDLAEARAVLAGSVNTSLAVVDGRGRRFWLRVYEEQDHAGAAREARLLSRLAAAGVATPAPLPLSVSEAAHGRFVASVRDKPVCLFPFVEGGHRCQASVSSDDAARVGAALAQVHHVGASFSEAEGLTRPSRFTMLDIRARLSSLTRTGLSEELARAAHELDQRAEALAGRKPTAPPVPLIHGDLFRDNVLFAEDGSVTLLDFESASSGSVAFDLMVTMLSWCFGDCFDRELARALVEGYSRVRPISDGDIAELLDQGRAACVRFATTRITDYELRPRDSGVYKDFRRFFSRIAALDALGPALPRFLGL